MLWDWSFELGERASWADVQPAEELLGRVSRCCGGWVEELSMLRCGVDGVITEGASRRVGGFVWRWSVPGYRGDSWSSEYCGKKLVELTKAVVGGCV